MNGVFVHVCVYQTGHGSGAQLVVNGENKQVVIVANSLPEDTWWDIGKNDWDRCRVGSIFEPGTGDTRRWRGCIDDVRCGRDIIDDSVVKQVFDAGVAKFEQASGLNGFDFGF